MKYMASEKGIVGIPIVSSVFNLICQDNMSTKFAQLRQVRK